MTDRISDTDNGGYPGPTEEQQNAAVPPRETRARVAGSSTVTTPRVNQLLPKPAGRAAPSDPARVARISVLAWKPDGDTFQNLFTMVRTRRRDAAGPWTPRSERGWRVRAVSDELRLLHADGTEEECQDIIRQILERGHLTAKGTEIHYALHPSPKHHRAYRDHLGDAEKAILSPFKHHSAKVTEYWSFDQKIMEQWLDHTASLEDVYKSALKDLGFPLDRASDRIGNILVARAEDSLTADLSFDPYGKALRFQIRTHGSEKTCFPSDVWACSSGNEILRQHIQAPSGVTIINVPYDVDHIGFAIYDEETRDCIDLMDVALIKEAHFNMEMQFGPRLDRIWLAGLA